MLSEILRNALHDRCKNESLESLGKKWDIDPTILGRFARSVRGLNSETTDKLAAGLGLVLVPESEGQREAMEGHLKRERVLQAAREMTEFSQQLRSQADRVAEMAHSLGRCI